MTFVDIHTKAGPVVTKSESVVEGRIERCGFDGGGEYGAGYVLTLEGSPKVYMLSSRRMQDGRSRNYLENTMALTKPGDQVSITYSSKGEPIGFDNFSAGRTMSMMKEQVSEKSTEFPVVIGVVGIFAAMILAVTVAWLISAAMATGSL